MSKYDSEWISNDLYSPATHWVDAYFSGKPRGEAPIWEMLVEGRAIILGTEARERACETVSRKWPQSLGLLELSRVAPELNSDLGVIAPIVTTNGKRVRVDIMLNFEDAKNELFLKKFLAYDGPKNTRDLNASAEIVPPDLSEFSIEFQFE